MFGDPLLLQRFDFDVAQLPPTFSLRGHDDNSSSRKSFRVLWRLGETLVATLSPFELLDSLVATIIRRAAIFPETNVVVQQSRLHTLSALRARLLSNRAARRLVLQTSAGHSIDACLLDRRHLPGPADSCAQILVVCCEDRLSYWEDSAGAFAAAAARGYSVLGWLRIEFLWSVYSFLICVWGS
jgi:hypothetical protein